MSWFLVDDQMPSDERMLATSLAARGLWATAGAWAGGHHTDVVPAHVLASLGSTPELETELADARVWHRAKAGAYRFEQDGLCRIPQKETVERQRQMATERQARWRAGKRQRDGGVDAPVDGAVDAPVDAVDNRVAGKTAGQSARGRRSVDASTAPSTWYPGPIPGSIPPPQSDQRDGSNARASPDDPETINAVIGEIRDTTGRTIDRPWAARVAADLLSGHTVGNPAAYVRQAIRREPSPARRFLPTPGPAPVADVLAPFRDSHDGPSGKHARREDQP